MLYRISKLAVMNFANLLQSPASNVSISIVLVGFDDFRVLRAIGRGAFGKVSELGTMQPFR